jgi:trk system potassium uptake protein TrkA
MDVVVIGMGEVGKHIASVLLSENHNVTLIDRSESALSHAHESMDVMTLSGDGGSIETLTQAGISSADLVIAVTDNDEVNLLAALMAKKLGAERVVARVSDTGDPLAAGGSWAANLGIDMVISPERAAADEIRRIIQAGGVSWVESFGEDRIEMIRLRVNAERSPAVGKALYEIPAPPNSLVAAIGRGEKFIIPDGSAVLADDDEIYLIGRTDILPDARAALVGPHRPVSKVVIMGASEIGLSLAHLLDNTGIDTCIIERSASRAEEIAMKLGKTVVYHGDGTQSDFLRSENLDNADVFIAVTRTDEVNLMAGLLAKKVGIETVIAVAHKADYAPIYEELGIDITISPRLLAANAILGHVRKGPVVSVSVLANGAGEILELQAVKGARVIGIPLKDVGFPQGARIGAVATEDEVTVPGGDFEIPVGARVIVFTTPDKRESVERLFRKKSLSIF